MQEISEYKTQVVVCCMKTRSERLELQYLSSNTTNHVYEIALIGKGKGINGISKIDTRRLLCAQWLPKFLLFGSLASPHSKSDVYTILSKQDTHRPPKAQVVSSAFSLLEG